MKVYKLRDRKTGEFINKNRKSNDRIYDTKRNAAAAASLIVHSMTYGDKSIDWWALDKSQRRKLREEYVEIVEFDCVEQGKAASVARATAIIKEFLATMKDPTVDSKLKDDLRDTWREALTKAGVLTY